MVSRYHLDREFDVDLGQQTTRVKDMQDHEDVISLYASAGQVRAGEDFDMKSKAQLLKHEASFTHWVVGIGSVELLRTFERPRQTRASHGQHQIKQGG